MDKNHETVHNIMWTKTTEHCTILCGQKPRNSASIVWTKPTEQCTILCGQKPRNSAQYCVDKNHGTEHNIVWTEQCTILCGQKPRTSVQYCPLQLLIHYTLLIITIPNINSMINVIKNDNLTWVLFLHSLNVSCKREWKTLYSKGWILILNIILFFVDWVFTRVVFSSYFNMFLVFQLVNVILLT